ncbi:MAG: DedA family protein [Gammaproteobacteria bacterium]|jgi:membrane protein YqaA with SNARE-associated domain|nr:DedA family protein [Gammaproteobacteria bacterium]
MRIFSALYERTMTWAAHRHAPWYLGGLSFAESSFFPIPPDVMLAPMSLARTDRAWWYATLTTVASVVGGLFGYLIGMLAIDAVLPLLVDAGYGSRYDQAIAWFAEWGVWVVFIAGFSPIPYKLFTISAGASAMALLPFTIASLVGRGARFFMVAGLMRWGGAPMEKLLRTYIDRLGWLVVFLGVVYVLIAH